MKGIFQAACGVSLLIIASPFIVGMVAIKAVKAVQERRMLEKELEKKGIKKFFSKEFNLNVWSVGE